MFDNVISPLPVRELKGRDFFALTNLVNASKIFDGGFKDTLKDLLTSRAGSKTKKAESDHALMSELGILIAQELFKALPLIEADLNKLLADLTAQPVEVIADLSLKDYTSLVFSTFNQKEFFDFLKSTFLSR